MNIKINETNHLRFEDSVLKDIGRFKNLQSWLLAIKNNEVAFHPLDCTVKVNNTCWRVVHGGQLAKDINRVINEVKKIPAVFRDFPNDYVNIKVDSFERELFFDINYRAD